MSLKFTNYPVDSMSKQPFSLSIYQQIGLPTTSTTIYRQERDAESMSNGPIIPGWGWTLRSQAEHTVKICRHLTTKILTTFSSEKNDDKPLSVDDTFVICDDRFVTQVPVSYAYNMGDDSVIKWP